MSFDFELEYFGKTLADYRGQGSIQVTLNQKAACEFVAGQLPNGHVLLICESSHSHGYDFGLDALTGHEPTGNVSPFFEGTTSDGKWRVSCPKAGLQTRSSYSFKKETSINKQFFVVDRLTAGLTNKNLVVTIRYGITNFEFIGSELRDNTFVLPLDLQSINEPMPFKLLVEPVRDYESVKERVVMTKSVDVTCEVVVEWREGMTLQEIESRVDVVCYLFSVARGTKVQWIYCHHCDVEGNVVVREHYDRVTKSYSGSPIIHPSREGREATKRFVEVAYPEFIARREEYKLTQGLIDSYLDAKSEADYIEIRSLKLVVVLEILKDIYLKIPSSDANEFVLEKPLFRRLSRRLVDSAREYLNECGASEDQIVTICNNLSSGVNRTSFKTSLRSLFSHFGHHVEEPELSLFVKCRNSLVHQGSFCSITEKELPCLFFEKIDNYNYLEMPESKRILAQYEFITSIVDRMVLKFFRYSGPYLDARIHSPTNENVFNRAEI